MTRPKFSVPMDGAGHPIQGAFTWTGEVQSVAFVTASSAATQITVPGRWFMFFATSLCHIVIGNAGIHDADLTAKNRCFPIPDGDTGGWVGPVYIPDQFDTLTNGTGDLYIKAIRNAADGKLYIASVHVTEGTLGRGATSSSTTTTSTSTTTTTTTTTSTTT